MCCSLMEGVKESIPTCSAAFNLVVNGSKINRLSVMVGAAEVGCVHWICYTVSYIFKCIAGGFNGGGGDGHAETRPNL